jgi:6,7-dimethyl-8-ribityllumazine synthase
VRIGDITESNVRAEGLRAVVIGARFNAEIVQKLVNGAVDTLKSRGSTDVRTIWVPGALEIPLVAKKVIEGDAPDLVVCVGCVIKGGTDHYEHVCRATVDGIMRVTLDTGVPVGNGVLTVATQQQAEERAGGAVGNKGAEAALAAIETVQVLRQVRARA